VIDVNRDPSGVSLYPGQATTGLVPLETFDGEPLYESGKAPDSAEIERRKAAYFLPYHDTLAAEIARLRKVHKTVVVYDCHSIRSQIPRLFEGDLPVFNIGSNSGASCDPAMSSAVEAHAKASGLPYAVNGRFKGGYITRHYGQPDKGVHAIQMELACRGYIADPPTPLNEANWPTQYDPSYAAPVRQVLEQILASCLSFAEENA
jgi:N-formylglutamate deformylase